MIDAISISSRRPLEPLIGIGLFVAFLFSLALCSVAQAADGYILKRSPEETCHSCHKTDKNRTSSDPDWNEAIKTHNSTNLSSTKWSPGGWGITGGKYGEFTCTTCHSSHDSKNIYLIRESISVPNGTDTWPNGTTLAAVDFRVLSGTPANPGPLTLGIMGDDSVAHSTSSKVCEACHSQNKYHNYNSASNSNNGHNNGVDCTTCHDHRNAFKGAGGSCKDCHQTGNSAGAPEIQPEFERNSHHISKTWADISDFDCAVCHAEAQISGTPAEVSINSNYHNNPTGTVDLLNADDRVTIYSISLANLTGRNATANDNLNTFCLICHDSDGAAGVTTGNGFPSGYEPTNPFGETTNIRTNSYDVVKKWFNDPGTPTPPDYYGNTSLNVKDAFDTARKSHHAVRGARYTVGAGATLAFGRTLRDSGFLSSAVLLFNGTTGVADNSVLDCNDCHSTAASAHGSANEYLLQTATSVNPTAEHADETEYVCLKCHVLPGGSYSDGGGTHTGNASDMVHTANLTGTARVTGNGSITGMACLNCHDGGVGFGGVHGVPDSTYTAGTGGSGQGTYNKRRFLPGSGLAYYDPGAGTTSTAALNAWAGRTNYAQYALVVPTSPNGYVYMATNAGQSSRTTQPSWPTTVGGTVNDNGIIWKNVGATGTVEWEWAASNATNTCYTLGGVTSYSGCTKHASGVSHNSRNSTRPTDY